jgi:hypothetical protein
MTTLIQLGVGEDGEPVIMEKVHDSCVLIHCVGNSQSPFEFNGDYCNDGKWRNAEENARVFAKLLYRFRLEKQLEGMIHE